MQSVEAEVGYGLNLVDSLMSNLEKYRTDDTFFEEEKT